MSANNSNGVFERDLDNCAEVAITPGSLFELTHRFIPVTLHQRVLALYALKVSVQSIPRISADDSVKWTKLKWWADELTADPAAPERHPVLRALWSCGARAKLSAELLQRLVIDCAGQIDDTPCSDKNALFSKLAAAGATDIELELSLEGAKLTGKSLEYLGAATLLHEVIASLSPGHRSWYWYLPLELVAKHGLDGISAENEPDAHVLAPALAEAAAWARAWFEAGMDELSTLKPCKHLQLRLAMEHRQMARVCRKPQKFLKAQRAFGPSDAWFAWRFMRRLQ